MQVISAVAEEVAEQVLRSIEEKLYIFVPLDGLVIDACSVLGKGVRASDLEIEHAFNYRKVKLVAVDREVMAVDVLEVHQVLKLMGLWIQNVTAHDKEMKFEHIFRDHFQNYFFSRLSFSLKGYFLNWQRLNIKQPSPFSLPCPYSFLALWMTVYAYSSRSYLLPSQSSQLAFAFFSHSSAFDGSSYTKALQAFAWLLQFQLLVTWSSLCSRYLSIISTDSLKAYNASFLFPTLFCMCPQYRYNWQYKSSGGTRLSSRTAKPCSIWSMVSQQLLFYSCFLAILPLTLARSMRILSDFLVTVELTWRKKSSQCLMGELFSSKILNILKQLMLSRLLFDCSISSVKTIMSWCFSKASFNASRSIPSAEKRQESRGVINLNYLRQSLIDLLRKRFIYIINSSQMDVRQRKEVANVSEMKDEKLTDSLIFNIIKKIELRMSMEEKYEVLRAPQLTIIPHQMGRHLHSTAAMGYLGIAMGSILYLRFRSKMALSFRALLPHVVIAISINQYERYRNIMNIDPELRNQYKSYQRNAKTIVEQMKSRVSLVEEFKKIKLVTFEKTVQMIKYKPLY